MMEMLTDAAVVIMLQYVNISNQPVVHLKLKKVYGYISILVGKSRLQSSCISSLYHKISPNPATDELVAGTRGGP